MSLGGSGRNSLSEASDVAFSGNATGDALQFDATSQKWKNQAFLTTISPSAIGSGTVGAATTAARADHVHPTTGLALAVSGGAETVSTMNAVTGAVTLNLANGNVCKVTLAGNVTFSFIGALTGKACAFSVYVCQDTTGGHTLVWPSSVKWPNGAVPTATTAANAIDLYIFESINGGSTWFGSQAGANYS